MGGTVPGCTRVRSTIALAAALASTSCCESATATHPPTTRARVAGPHPDFDMDPSPWLWLVRSERVKVNASPGAMPPLRGIHSEPVTAPEEAAAGDADDPIFVEGETRRVDVRTHRLATLEDLARAILRNAPARRPPDLFFARMLVRVSGIICDCDGSQAERARVRSHLRKLVARARPAIVGCVVDDVAADPRVIIKAPAPLVIHQAAQFDDLVYGLVSDVRVARDGVHVDALACDDGPLTHELSACITRALQDAGRAQPWLRVPHRVRLPLVVFDQGAPSHGENTLHGKLAVQAAVFGWLHLERGELVDALEFFRDAHWVYQLPEYRYLMGMVYEQAGDHLSAMLAFGAYLAARPDAPESDALARRYPELDRG